MAHIRCLISLDRGKELNAVTYHLFVIQAELKAR